MAADQDDKKSPSCNGHGRMLSPFLSLPSVTSHDHGRMLTPFLSLPSVTSQHGGSTHWCACEGCATKHFEGNKSCPVCKVPAAALIQVFKAGYGSERPRMVRGVFKAGYGSERPRMVRGVFREHLSLVKGSEWWEVLKTRYDMR